MRERHPRIAAVVLAAGTSTRMGSNKLLAHIHGEPLVRRVASSIAASAARPIIVVTGHDHERVRAALAGTKATFVHNPDYSEGLSTSLRAGIRSAADCDGAIICLGDMPAISAGLIDRMLASYDPANRRAICAAFHKGSRGNPVLFDRRFFPELEAIAGDIGAQQVVSRHRNLVCEIEADDDAPLIDLDTPEDFELFLARP